MTTERPVETGPRLPPADAGREHPRGSQASWGQDLLDGVDRVWDTTRARWPGGPPAFADVVLTLVLLMFCLPFAVQAASYGSALGGIAGLMVVPMFALPFLWRRTFPGRAAAVVVVAHLLQLILISEPSSANVTAPLVAYSVARWADDRRVRRLILVVAAIGGLLGAIDWTVNGWGATSATELAVVIAITTFFCLATAVSAWLLGALVRQRAQSLEQTRQRAEAVERGRVQNMRLAAQEERARIAREMHDVVAHSLSVIVVQSDGASYALDRAAETEDPQAALAALRGAAAALTTIGQTARESLADTRRLVAVLRRDEGQPEYTPTGGVDSLGELIEPLRLAGLHITSDVSGTPRPISRAADLAAYRVVQESLTNVIKHAGEASVWVSVDYLDHALLVTVRDDGVGVGAAPDGQGHGLVGMKERVTAVDGDLWAGGAPGGGFVVEARIPYDARTLGGRSRVGGENGQAADEKEMR
ncbi:sensor histidine kinase [Mobilicoccus caccae]|uniref:histidine kinase n=1 Tax=Mobilicoccus caccae TaxID=1859295 RepID=A0ABQ6IZT2_9MICO|nr:sensor histidine kinase [Mobilicoccus caccae]GMA42213.1 two-component sensor histidine kinase [Mobilicoccus caccae]